MSKLFIEIQEDTLNRAKDILEDLGLDVESAIRMFLKRVIRDQSVGFVLNNIGNITTNEPPVLAEKVHSRISTVKCDRGEMRKSLAVKMFRERGITIDKNVTYSSKNRTTYNYWSNPNFSVLEEDWSLILNDWLNRQLYLFRIPRNSISASQLIPRNDQKDLIDIQILENDPDFVDRRSGFGFKVFLVDNIKY